MSLSRPVSENLNRFVIIKRNKPPHKTWKELRESDWQVKEVDFCIDKIQLAEEGAIPGRIVEAVTYAHVFFSVADGVVGETTLVEIYVAIEDPDIRKLYAQQMATEALHAEAYRRVAKVLCKGDLGLFNKMCADATTDPAILRKITWVLESMKGARNVAAKVVIQAIVEGVFFFSSFALMAYCRKEGYLPGVGQNNWLILMEEYKHWEIGAYITYPYFPKTEHLSPEDFWNYLATAVSIEEEYNKAMLGEGVPGLTLGEFNQYTQYIADQQAMAFGYEPRYKVENPFPFMVLNSLTSKINFFDRKGADYVNGEAIADNFATDADI